MLAMLVVQGAASRNKRAAQLLVLCLHPFLAALAFLEKKTRCVVRASVDESGVLGLGGAFTLSNNTRLRNFPDLPDVAAADAARTHLVRLGGPLRAA